MFVLIGTLVTVVPMLRFLLKRFLDQDKEMMESEQATFAADPEAARIEINPAVVALRPVTVAQDRGIAVNEPTTRKVSS